MALLKNAAGKRDRSPDTIRSETALDPLRKRDDFTRLMADPREAATKSLASRR